MVLDRSNWARHVAWLLLPLAVCLVMVAAAPRVAAQDAAEPPNSPAPAAADDRSPVSPVFAELKGDIEQVGPDTYILLDEKGNPQPVLNMRIEQFIEAWKQRAQLTVDPTTSDYTLDECRFLGSLEGNYAILTATLTVTLHESGSVEVPLGLAGALLRKLPAPPDGRADGRYLRYDPTAGGYLATLNGAPGATQQVELELMVPIRQDGARASMELLAPRATKGSLVLVSKNAIQSVVASEGVVLSASPLAAGGMRVEAEGVAGEFSLSWVDRPATGGGPPESVLSASTQVLISIDGRDVRSSSRITVEAFGQSFREFTVRLPRGARPVQTGLAPPVESFEQIGDMSSAGEEAGVDAKAGSEWRVTLSADQSKAVTVELQTIEPLHGTSNGIALALGGFEVVGAVPQQGEVGLLVDDGWQLRWEPNDSVQPVHRSEVDFSWATPAAAADSLTAAFRFARQPWVLPVRLVPREQRVVATPAYELTIQPGEALLQMEVAYRIEGGRTLPTLFSPEFALAGWDHQQTTTRSIEDTLEVEEQADTYAFRAASATSRRPTVTLEFRRSLDDREGGRIELPLPEPKGDALVLTPGSVTVTADTSLQLTPDLASSAGLVPVPMDTADDIAAGRPPGQQFRYRAVYHPLVFGARVKPREQRLLVDCETLVSIGADHTVVDQFLEFDVRYQALSSLPLVWPNTLTNLELELLPTTGTATSEQGTPLDISGLLSESTSAGANLPERRIPLPHPRLGKFRVHAHYLLEPIAPQSTAPYVLSLLTVSGAEFGEHQLRLASPTGTTLRPIANSRWRSVQAENGTLRAGTNEYSSDRQSSFLTLGSTGRSPTPDTLEIERIWVQTWLTPRVLQSRTAFQFRGDAARARIELPTEVPNGEQFEVVVDGVPTTDWSRDEGALLVNLPGDVPRDRRTLELRYRVPDSLGWAPRIAPGRPHLNGDDSSAALFWQVVAPVEYQCLSSSASLATASHTRWSEGDWRSQSEWDTAELEQWINATEGALRPTRGEHDFLLRGLPDSSLEVRLVRRELLMLAVSGLVLAACFALAYLPWLRRPPVLLLAAAALLIAGLAVPPLAAALAPLGLYGLVCGLFMWVLMVMYGPQKSPSAKSGAPALDPSGTHRSSAILPLGSATVSSNAPTVSVELADSNA